MSHTPLFRLYCFHPHDPARRGWHLAEVDPANPKRILRFVKQRRSRLLKAREQWRGQDGALASQQQLLLTSRLLDLDERARIAALFGPLGVR